RRERHRRCVNRRATGRVCHHRGRRSATGGARLSEVERAVEVREDAVDAGNTVRLRRVERVSLGRQRGDEAFELGDVRATTLFANRTAHRGDEANRGDLTTTAAGTVATGG